jgi:hypothetical protein
MGLARGFFEMLRDLFGHFWELWGPASYFLYPARYLFSGVWNRMIKINDK